MRRYSPFVLSIDRPNPFAQAAVKIAATLKELNGLPDQIAGERIADRKRSEDKESIGGDAEKQV